MSRPTILNGTIEILSGPDTHICWTPAMVTDKTDLVVLVRADDLRQLEERVLSLEAVIKKVVRVSK